MHDLAPCHTPKKTRTFFESKEIPVLKWPGNNYFHRGLLEYNEERDW